MRTLYVNDARAQRRRIPVWLTLSSDGVSPATAEAGGQPTLSINGAADSSGNVGVLVAVKASQGEYYVELAQAALATLRPGDRVRVLYDSANTVPWAETWGVAANPYAHEGTAAAATATTLTLENANGVSAVDNVYVGAQLYIYAGTGAGQPPREVSSYVGATRVATVASAFLVTPDTTSQYVLVSALASVNLAAATIAAVSGAVGSVTGNVGGNVVGSVGSVAAGGITASSVAADAIGASELASDAVTEIAQAVRAEIDSASTQLAALITRLTSTRAGYLDQIPTIATQTDTVEAGIAALPTAVQNADALLNRNAEGGSNTGVLVKHKLAGVPNKIAINRTANTMTVYALDGTTALMTVSLTFTTGGAIASITP